jgi:hypothetical protein
VNLAPVITSLATGTYTVTRRDAATSGVDGRQVAASVTTFDILASVQPMGGRDLQRLPEGLRAAERLSVYTATPLRVSRTPDTVEIDGETWEVEVVEQWGGIAGYCKATVAKVGH